MSVRRHSMRLDAFPARVGRSVEVVEADDYDALFALCKEIYEAADSYWLGLDLDRRAQEALYGVAGEFKEI